MGDIRTEEDKIIEILQIEGGSLYEDMDFIPGRQSLYDMEDFVPLYDEEIVNNITWKRPNEFCERVEYFTESLQCPAGVQGTLNDEIFLGTLLSVCSYIGQDLIQNIIASRPEDFKDYGVFTCRFYVEGEWVDVITDTRIPCFQDPSGHCTPVYGRSAVPEEMWICLVEKAYAKAVGSYEALQKVKVNEALLHLTGGSVQQFNIQDELKLDDSYYTLWTAYKEMLQHDTLILSLPIAISDGSDSATGAGGGSGGGGGGESKDRVTKDDMSRAGVVVDRLYSVLACKEIGNHELLMLCNPWGKVRWSGAWAEASVKWDDFPEVLHAIEEDPSIAWRRDDPQGFIWMTFKEYLNFFNNTYTCKIFSNEKFKYYCVKGEWKDFSAGGPMHTVRDKDTATKAALESLQYASRNCTAALAIDGDCAWFNNPQYKVTTNKSTTIFISVLSYGNETENSPIVAIDVVALPKRAFDSQHLWDCTYVEQIATEKIFLTGRMKGVEASVWNVNLHPKTAYYIVPHTMRRGIIGNFILRIHALDTIHIEHIDPLHNEMVVGEWRRSSESDTTGGPMKLPVNGKKENPKWCQNPQYHLELTDPFIDQELNIKLVIKRTDKHSAGKTALQTATAGAAEKAEPHIGFVICKAEFIEDSEPLKKNAANKGPRKNAFGEVMQKKESSLKKTLSSSISHEAPSRTLLRKITLTSDTLVAASTYSTRNDSCIMLSNVPRVWMKNGLMIIPSLSEKNVRATYELEAFCSEPISFKLVPDNSTKSIAGEWVENLAGGSHLCSTWKKNPKFTLKLRTLSSNSFKVRITLRRFGETWKKHIKKDMVGCMIGFYVFINRSGELINILETPFVPADEVSTEPGFELDPLGNDEVYTVMPTTHSENHLGAFVLTVMSTECDISFAKESTSSSHHHHK
mmetsp:Transcript_31078/g.31618  ORF Transcript_31078/g.31618 Transcript_31078/m.31618 type:complete len:912 (+) Transcript_31078:48-2783(+)